MMPVEILEIVDTSVKIGLGALISGVATYIVSNKNNAHQISKEVTVRKLASIEKSAEEINEHFSCFGTFISALDGVRRQHPGAVKVPGHSLQFICENDSLLTKSRGATNAAISRLLLLGIKDPILILEEVKQLEAVIRTDVIFNNKLPSQDAIEGYRNLLKEFRASFYEQLSKHNMA